MNAGAVRALRGLVLGAGVLALAACSSLPSMNPLDWFGSSSTLKPAPLPPLSREQPVRVLWNGSIGASGAYIFTPAVVGDAVFVAAQDGSVARLDAATGAVRWRISTGVRLTGGAGSDGSLVSVASGEGEVFVLDASNGTVKWRARVSSEVLAAPAVGGGLVLVRSADSRVFAFEAADGKRRWVYQRAAATLVVRSPAGVTLQGDTAFAGFSGGKLVAISLENGGPRWEATVALPRGATELERITDIVGDPTILAREICAVAYQGRVACFDIRTGNQIWSRPMSSITGVTMDVRYAYVSDDTGGVHALDRISGRSVWKQDRLTNRRLSRPYAAGNAIAVGDLEGYVHFVARESGAFVARHATDGSAIRAAPQRVPGGFLVQTQNGALVALAL